MAPNPPTNGATLTRRQQRRLLGPPLSNQFDPTDRLLFGSWDGGTVFDVGEGDAHAIRDMLRKDGTSRSLEQVITLPLRGAEWEIRSIEGDRGEAEFVRTQLGARMDVLIAQVTSACVYRKAFFELSWDVEGDQVVLADIGFRPATACEAAFDGVTGEADGFRKRISALAGVQIGREVEKEDPHNPGYARIVRDRAFIYTHGTHREPLVGLSDMDIPHWAWETQQKIMFLWYQFLEQQSLPKTVTYGRDVGEAQDNAAAIAEAKASGVIPLVRDDPTARMFDVLESSGRGGDQYVQAVRWLDSRKTQSVLASFTELAVAASNDGRGSNALSMDQSEFFLASRQAVADEMADAITNSLITRLVRWNFGADAHMPWLKIGPLSQRNTDRALEVLKTILPAGTVNAPAEFTDQLLTSTATYLGLDPRKLSKAIEAQQRTTPPPKPGAPPGEPPPLDAALADAVGLSHTLVTSAQRGDDPGVTLDRLTGAPTTIALAGAEQERSTVGFIALVPDAASASRLALGVADAEKPADLHLTVLFLGEDVTGWSSQIRQRVVDAVRAVAKSTLPGPVHARAWSHATFNPDGGQDGESKPCAVYLIGAPELPALHEKMGRKVQRVLGEGFHPQHSPYVPHVTVGYNMAAGDLSYTGPVTFDRLVVSLAGDVTEIPLGDSAASPVA